MKPIRRADACCRPDDHLDYAGQPPTAFQPQPCSEGLGVSFFGTAVAVGESTFASSSTTLHVVNRGRFSFAYGQAELAAAAAGAGGGSAAYAAVDGGFQTSGSDLSITCTQRTSAMGENGGWATETLVQSFVAIDIAGLTLAGGPVALSRDRHDPGSETGPELQGNVAVFQAEVVARGQDTFVETNIGAIASDTGFASVDVSATAAVEATMGPTVTGTRRDDRICVASGDALVDAGRGDDLVRTGDGDDLIFAGSGDDTVYAGEGDNTILGGRGRDCIVAGNGDDWILGGAGADVIHAGGGSNLVDGGEGRDRILCGGGDDTIRGGDDDDWIMTGSGDNLVIMGAPGCGDDGDDHFVLGGGRDTFAILSGSGNDFAVGFRVAQGDRIALDCGSGPMQPADLALLNGALLTLSRGRHDRKDLVLTIDGDIDSTLTLDDFFVLNPGYDAPAKSGALSDAQAVPILLDILCSLDEVKSEGSWMGELQVVDLLSLLG
jgi:Ca2+-binding RTX toxin-like protein